MDGGAREPEQELLDLITASWKSQVIRAASELDIAGCLAEKPMTVAEMARSVGANEDGLRRLLRALATLGLVETVGGGLFQLTPTGAALGSVRDWARWWGGYVWDEWAHLTDSIRTGKPVRPLLSGAKGLTGLERDTEAAAVFDRAMAELTHVETKYVLDNYDFSGCRHVVDLGGGYGELLVAILQRYPTLTGAVFDLPRARQGALAQLAGAGVGDRAQVESGDLFDFVPGGADVYVLKNVIHDWDDTDAHRILTSCRRAMVSGTEGGAVLLVIERVVPDEPHVSLEHQAVARSDLHMLLAHGAKERTEAEFDALLTGAGLELRRVAAAGLGLSILEATVLR